MFSSSSRYSVLLVISLRTRSSSAMFVALLSLIVISPVFVLSYNVDTEYPIVYGDPEHGESNYFGFSVALRPKGNGSDHSRLFVGAPRSSGENGSVYGCILTENTTLSNSSCQKLIIDPTSAPTYVRALDSRRNIDVYRVGNNGWLGASMATGEYSDLTVCAPHSYVTFRNNLALKEVYMHDMRGLCYDLPNGLGDILHRDNAILKSYEFPLTEKNCAIYGFSVNYPVRKDPDMVERIIGKPRINAVEIAHKNIKEERSQNPRDFSYLGYSVASGYFFKHEQLFFAAGAPASLYKGMVVVFEPASDNAIKIFGSVLGEYFGASLATGDFDGNGLDDIAVGAPHWGVIDYGRVYTFSANDEKTDFKEGLMLQGASSRGMFGYTLASADLDSDGFSDLIVGAPFEDSGIVYVYYGNREFGIKGGTTPVSQKIEPSKFANPISVKRFGFAISAPVDIDNNGYPDLAIGAYKSGHAVLLRSRPVIETKLNLNFTPSTLDKNTKNFSVGVCLLYNGKKAPNHQTFRFNLTIDEIHNRVEDGILKARFQFYHDQYSCGYITLRLKDEIINYIDPIVITVKHDTESGSNGNKFCPSCPVLSRRSLEENIPFKLPFNTGCKDGIVCNSSLSVGWTFDNVINENEWIVGSGDVDLNLLIRNDDEPAYMSQLTIIFPPGIELRKAILTCSSTRSDSMILTLNCDIGNPLVKGEIKELKIGLDMKKIVESAGGTVLGFMVITSTRSNDRGYNPTTIYLNLKNDASITLMGITFEVNQDFGRSENKTKVPLRHAYRVRKFKATPVKEALLAIDVPVGLTTENITFVDILVPKLNSNGKFYSCKIINTKEERIALLSQFVDAGERRLLRSITDYNVESNAEETIEGSSTFSEDPVTIENDQAQGNGTFLGHRGVGENPIQMTYMNCSMDSITCATVSCRFELSKTFEDVGNLLLDMTFDSGVIYETHKDVPVIVKFSTNATVQIIEPAIKSENNTHRASANASTILYKVPEQEPLAEWIVPCSIAFGVLLFIILVIALVKIGFFKRPDLQEAARAKEMQLILKAEDESSQDPFG